MHRRRRETRSSRRTRRRLPRSADRTCHRQSRRRSGCPGCSSWLYSTSPGRSPEAWKPLRITCRRRAVRPPTSAAGCSPGLNGRDVRVLLAQVAPMSEGRMLTAEVARVAVVWIVVCVLLVAVELHHMAFFSMFGAAGAGAAAVVALAVPSAVALQVIVAV